MYIFLFIKCFILESIKHFQKKQDRKIKHFNVDNCGDFLVFFNFHSFLFIFRFCAKSFSICDLVV